MHEKQESEITMNRMSDSAFELKIRSFEPYLKKILYGILRSPDRTDDVYQVVLQKIYCAMDGWSGENFKAWIARIAVNAAIDAKRKENGERDWVSLDEIDEERLPDEAVPSPETAFIAAETMCELNAMIDGLDEIYRVPLQLYYRTNRSIQEIAVALDLSPRTVETRIYRARQILREKWSHHAAF